jgi:adenine/guanine phosphoribosyltransferase-like PRPP-binding protein
VEQTGAKATAIYVIVELSGLNGRNGLKTPIESLVSYQD